MPEEGTDDEPLGLDQRSRSLALAGVGVLALLCAVGDWAGAFWFPWPLAIVAALVVLFLHRKERAQSAERLRLRRAGHRDRVRTARRAPALGDVRPARRGPATRRKRGPILFFFTLALIALAEGVLGVVDLAGVAVADSAYPALALGDHRGDARWSARSGAAPAA